MLALDIRQALLQQFNHHGWERMNAQLTRISHSPWGYSVLLPGAVLPGQGGWSAEVWKLESTWSPQGLHAYLLFSNDHFNGPLERVRIYNQPPDTLGYFNRWDGWRFRHRWRADLPILFAELARIREEHTLTSPSSPPPSGPEARMQLLRKLSERRVRLFTCACLRRFWHIVEKERNQQAIETMEKYADGVVRKRHVKKARKVASIPWLTSYDAYAEVLSTLHAAERVLTKKDQRVLEELLSDVSGNLDSAVSLRPSWLHRNGGIVLKMAQAIYADQSFIDLPILADALEEAGCDNAVILNHCRQPTEHARGCWVLDLLLSKS